MEPPSFASSIGIAGTFSSFYAASMAATPGLLNVQNGQSGGGGVGLRLPAKPDANAARAATQAHSGAGFIAADYVRYIGRSVGSGQCVALVQATSPGIGPTRNWVSGAPVQGNADLRPGTAIATFDGSSRYGNNLDGSSHAAIYLGQNERGIQVMDQWAGNTAAVRTIPWSNPSGIAANTGAAFHVVQSG